MRRSIGASLLVLSLVVVFALDVGLPGIVLLPFLAVPVVAAATFLGPRATTGIGVLAVALGATSGALDTNVDNEDYAIRLAGLALGCVVAVYLAHLTTTREARLNASEERLRLMLDHTADVVLRSAPDGTLLWASPSLQTVFGWDPETVVGTAFTLTSDDVGPSPTDVLRLADLAGRTSLDGRFSARRADGQQLWAETRATLVRDGHGDLESVVSSTRDVTAQVAAEQRLAEREQRYRLLADNVTDAIMLMDDDWNIVWASRAVSTELGYPDGALLGRQRLDFVHFEDRRTAVEQKHRTAAGEHATYEERFVNADGTYRWMSVSLSPFLDETGARSGFVAALRDIDDEVATRHRLARSERMFRLAMDGAAEGMAVVGLHHRFLEVNAALSRLTGRDADWLAKHDEEDLFPEGEVEALRTARDRLLSGGTGHETHVRHLPHAAGHDVWINHAVGLVRDEGGLPLFYVCQYQDITAAHLDRLDLAHRVDHDPLTGVASRAHVMDLLSHDSGHDRRSGSLTALVYCDIDHFKRVNDSLGHEGGDAALRAVARRIESVLRDGDVVGRLGGDEFVVLLRGVRDSGTALAVADKIRLAAGAPIAIGDATVTCRISAGVALVDPGARPEDALRYADAALYASKRHGRDRVTVHEGGPVTV